MHFSECLTECLTEYQKRRLLVSLLVTLPNQIPATYIKPPRPETLDFPFKLVEKCILANV